MTMFDDTFMSAVFDGRIEETELLLRVVLEREDIINPLLRERVKYLKETEGGKQEMCKIVEDLITEEKIEMAKKAILRGKQSIEDIAEVLELPLPFVEELARTQLQPV